ncbi:MAG: DUF4272 domain-containing protein [Pseudomonadota bacterium]
MQKTRFLTLTVGFLLCAHQVAANPTLEERKAAIKSMSDNEPSSEQLGRKRQSELVLREEGVPFNEYLPVIESSAEAKIRSEGDVELRALCLVFVAVKGEGVDHETVKQLIAAYGLEPHLTPRERAFINDPEPSEHDRVQFVWRYESAWVLLWALGFIDELPRPDKIADVPQLTVIVGDRTTESFREAAVLRDAKQILDQADLTYRYHWAVVDARISGEESPSGLDSSVVYERHYALNWLISYMGQDWDDVSTDT